MLSTKCGSYWNTHNAILYSTNTF